MPNSVSSVPERLVAASLLPLAAPTAARAHVSVAFVPDRFPDRARSVLIVAGSVIGMLALSPLIYAGAREFIAVVEKGSFFYGDLNLPK